MARARSDLGHVAAHVENRLVEHRFTSIPRLSLVHQCGIVALGERLVGDLVEICAPSRAPGRA
jgi:hypothetical protein